MKIRVPSLHIWLFVGLLSTACAFSASCIAQQMQARKISLNLKKVPLSVNGQLQINLNAMPTDGSYIIGIHRIGVGGVVAMGVGEMIMGESAAPVSHPFPESLTDWTNIVTAPNLVNVNGLGALHGTLLMFAQVPLGTRLTLQANGQIVSDMTPTEDLIIQNGQVSTQPKVSMATLGLKLTFPDSNQTLPAVVQQSPGVFIANPSSLGGHIVSYSLPSPASTDESVFVHVKIDIQGNVVSATSKSNSEFSQSCQETVLHWKFRPFTFDDKPVSVTTVISFVSMQHVVQTPYTH